MTEFTLHQRLRRLGQITQPMLFLEFRADRLDFFFIDDLSQFHHGTGGIVFASAAGQIYFVNTHEYARCAAFEYAPCAAFICRWKVGVGDNLALSRRLKSWTGPLNGSSHQTRLSQVILVFGQWIRWQYHRPLGRHICQ